MIYDFCVRGFGEQNDRIGERSFGFLSQRDPFPCPRIKRKRKKNKVEKCSRIGRHHCHGDCLIPYIVFTWGKTNPNGRNDLSAISALFSSADDSPNSAICWLTSANGVWFPRALAPIVSSENWSLHERHVFRRKRNQCDIRAAAGVVVRNHLDT